MYIEAITDFKKQNYCRYLHLILTQLNSAKLYLRITELVAANRMSEMCVILSTRKKAATVKQK